MEPRQLLSSIATHAGTLCRLELAEAVPAAEENDDRADWRAAWALFPGDVAYVWHAGVYSRTVIESLEAAGFAVRSQIVWAKPRFVLGRGDYRWQHEPCLYAVRKGATEHWQGGRDQATLWAIAASGDEDAATVHGTQKPVGCMRRPMLNNSAPGDAVYEPFCGSDTTIIAAETTGRICCAMDIDARYVDVAVQRWEQLTGREATRHLAGAHGAPGEGLRAADTIRIGVPPAPLSREPRPAV